jgi:hypothetical protein
MDAIKSKMKKLSQNRNQLSQKKKIKAVLQISTSH